VQAQYAPSSYVGLWSRLEGFERDDLTRALERRSVIQGTLMRMTIHLVSARADWPMTEAIRSARRAWWLGGDTSQSGRARRGRAAERARDLLGDGSAGARSW
jgi:hypothetical protein